MTFHGIKELADRLKSDPISTPINGMLLALTTFIIRMARGYTPVYLGDLRDSYEFEMSGGAGPVSDFVFIGSPLKYAPYVEFGTRPHWPPRAALLAWAASKGIEVFLVQRAIATRGTFGIHMLAKAVNDHIGEINYIVGSAAWHIEDVMKP